MAQTCPASSTAERMVLSGNRHEKGCGKSVVPGSEDPDLKAGQPFPLWTIRRRSPRFSRSPLDGPPESSKIPERKRTKFHRTQAAKGIAKPVFDRGRVDGERLTQHQGAIRSVAMRRANASEKPLLHLGHNLWLSHFVGSFHRYNTYADLVSLHPLFQFALCLTGAKYQNRFCITDTRNYLIVVICEMPHIISFPRIICRNHSCGSND